MYIKLEEPIISLRTAKDGDKELVLIGGMNHRVGAKIDLDEAFESLEEVAKKCILMQKFYIGGVLKTV